MAENKSVNSNNQYGSLKISGHSDDCFFADIPDFSYAEIYISGSDINKETELRLTTKNVTTGVAEIKNVPAGKNRIITVVPFDSENNEIAGQTLRSVTDISAGSMNIVSVTQETTSYGNILYELKEFFIDLSDPGDRTLQELSKLRAAVDTSVHPALYDYKNLTGSYKAFSPIMDKSYYVISPSSFSFDYFLNDNFTVSINDPISKPETFRKAGKNKTISNVVPGNWMLSIRDSNGNLLEKSAISVSRSQKNESQHIPHDGIALLIEKQSGFCTLKHKISQNNTVIETESKACKTVISDNGEYFVFDLPDISSISFNFADKNNKTLFPEYTELKSQGVYLASKDSVTPLTEITEFLDLKLKDFPLTEENFKTFYYDDCLNNRIIMLLNPKIYSDLTFSKARVEFNSGINDVDGFSGKKSSFQKDETGIWFTVISYNDLRGPNQSGQPTYQIVLDDTKVFNCAEKLKENNLDGYVYVKYNNKDAAISLPVIIFEAQNKNAVTKSLENEKKELLIKDFDFSKEEDQKKVANFRAVPGTTSLFRSYHPYNNSKSIFQTEPYRLYYVAKLAEKYGIKSDIQVGGESSVETKTIDVFDGEKIVTVSNYLPEYYKQIVKNDNVFFLYKESKNKWSYDIGYFNVTDKETNAKEFACYMGLMIKFINSHPGPYQTHCSIGTDRTGTTCGIFAAMCGASYPELEADYCSSQNMGIYEYRGQGCIRYVMEEFLRVDNISDPAQVPDLQKAVIDRLTTYGNVTAEEVNTCIERLGGTLPKSN